jgi:hypothetical protein
MTDEPSAEVLEDPDETYTPNPDYPIEQTDNGVKPEDGDQSDVDQDYHIVIEEDFDDEAAGLPTRQQLLNVCRSYLGVHEDPDGSNRTIIGAKFGYNGVAWCQEGDVVCEHQAGMPTFKTASTMEAVAHARKAGTFHKGTAGIQPGDSVYFHWPTSSRPDDQPDHVERVEVVHGPNDVTTIGFNVGNAVRRVHRRANFLGYERHTFNDNPAPRPPAGQVRMAKLKADAQCYATRAGHAIKDLVAKAGGEVAVEHFDNGWARIHWGGSKNKPVWIRSYKLGHTYYR